jgi:Tfp pilus assembly protein PilV
MLERLRDEAGMGLVELTIAMFMLTIALLALAAGYDSAAISVHNADKKTVAAKLAASQIELYQSLKVSLIGLDQTTLSNIQAAGSSVPGASDYVNDEAGLSPRGSDHTIASCGTTPQCSPIQDVAGPENHPYRIETFVRDVVNSGATGTWNERWVTIIVRDRGTTGNPVLFSETSAFDPGPS